MTYGTLFVLNVFMGYYIMLYGLSLGYDKSVEWLLAFFSGFFLNVFFLMPVKVVGMATVLVVFLNVRMTMRDQSPLKKLGESVVCSETSAAI